MKCHLNFVILLLTCIGTSKVHAQEFTVSDVFNYQVGDSFHFIDTSTFISDFPSVFKEVVNKKYTANDSLYIELEVITDDTIVDRLITMAIADLDKPVFDTTGLKILEISPMEYLGQRSVQYSYGVMDENNEVILFTDRFSQGLGITYHVEQRPDRRYAYKMVYYRSGNDSMGEKVMTKVELYQGEPTVLVEPDPFSSSTTVTLVNAPKGMKSLQLRMINMAGKEVMNAEVYPDVPHTIRAHASLEPGIYVLVFEAGDFMFTRKITFKP